MITRLWTWIKGVRAWWLVVPVVAAVIVRGLGRLFRKPAPTLEADGPTLTPDAARANREATEARARDDHKAVTVEFTARRRRWFDKFLRGRNGNGSKILIFCAAVAGILGSCGAPTQAVALPDPGATDPVAQLAEACEPADDDPDLVTCRRDAFVAAGVSMLEALEALAHCRIDMDRAGALGAIDVAAERHRRIAAESALASPWRSPWLWGLIGLATGAATVTAVTLGVKAPPPDPPRPPWPWIFVIGGYR